MPPDWRTPVRSRSAENAGSVVFGGCAWTMRHGAHATRTVTTETPAPRSSMLSRVLKGNEYDVRTANSVDGIVGKIKSWSPDIVLLDINLPERNGIDILKEIVELEMPTQIVMLTADDTAETAVKAMKLGAADYLTKPFHFGELVARLRSLVRRNSATKTAVLEIHGLSLDLRKHCAIREGREIPLTAKEFALLEYFMLHPDTVLSRDQISEHVWDMNFEPKSNVIESFVKFLRQKVDKGFGKPLIHTVRGSGYMFSENAL
jgi:DNA-binding response OmpR family regulator